MISSSKTDATALGRGDSRFPAKAANVTLHGASPWHLESFVFDSV